MPCCAEPSLRSGRSRECPWIRGWNWRSGYPVHQAKSGKVISCTAKVVKVCEITWTQQMEVPRTGRETQYPIRLVSGAVEPLVQLNSVRISQWICPCLYLEHPAIWNCFSLSLAQINPGCLELYYIPKKHWLKSVRKYVQGTSGQDVSKADKCIDVFTVTKTNSVISEHMGIVKLSLFCLKSLQPVSHVWLKHVTRVYRTQ